MRFGRWEILSEIGRGGAAIVYRGRGSDGRDVAVKVLQGTEPEDVARFLREQRVHAQLGYREGYVPLVDAGVAPEGPWLVMPYVRGGTLRDRMEKGPLEVDVAVLLGIALAGALAHAHARGIVHRDLKPENVLFSSDGRPFITDLGLAKHFVREVPSGFRAATVTSAGDACGSLGYMAPEQLGDSQGIAAPADVFALGAIVYESLAGRPAFSVETPLALVRVLSEGKIDPLGTVRPDVPAWLEAVVHRCLERFPEDRFPDGAALARALARRGE